MAYNLYPAFNPYQPGYYPQPQIPTFNAPAPQPQPVQTPPSGGINWCQGEEGAKAYMVAAGSTVLLMDSEKSSFYIKSTDQSGVPLPLRIFDYKERTEAATARPQQSEPSQVEYVTRKEFDALEARLDALTAKRARGAKSVPQKEDDE